ncbi:riboflavin synthase [Parvularcula marina]|uniref:Riboflavin synthase n=1 Tax=Parvularcula marina TaxID=2292771 RepID=A0A371RJM1_9PROT|nr:riboflavin synthase [Parvularcula marina]RFB05652.1 riboflavin synthase [Parvularcula marina]
MFTGLVEEMGTVRRAGPEGDGYILDIAADTVLEDVRFGDSISVEGVCLSVTEFDRTRFKVGLAPETLNRTTLGDLKEGDRVNLERSLLPTTRLGGHYVQGHVDGTGWIREVRPDGDALWVIIDTSPEIMHYIVRKGYISVDGTSLTVVETGTDWFSLTLISHTQPLVTLGTKKPGDRVNLETDIMAKYAEKALAGRIAE